MYDFMHGTCHDDSQELKGAQSEQQGLIGKLREELDKPRATVAVQTEGGGGGFGGASLDGKSPHHRSAASPSHKPITSPPRNPITSPPSPSPPPPPPPQSLQGAMRTTLTSWRLFLTQWSCIPSTPSSNDGSSPTVRTVPRIVSQPLCSHTSALSSP